MLGPFFIRRRYAVRQHRCQVTGLKNAYTICPNFVITVTPCFHKEEDRHENRIDRDSKMWVARRAEYERQRGTGRNYSPVCGCVKTGPPNIGPLHLAAIEMNER